MKRLRGISVAGLGQKGSDVLAIPACRPCHEKIHAGKLQPSREEILELIVTLLICFLDENSAGIKVAVNSVSVFGRTVNG
jgi:hypothetical protein